VILLEDSSDFLRRYRQLHIAIDWVWPNAPMAHLASGVNFQRPWSAERSTHAD
jgi:hypothetical protein